LEVKGRKITDNMQDRYHKNSLSLALNTAIGAEKYELGRENRRRKIFCKIK
jgi:hypothetical protein